MKKIVVILLSIMCLCACVPTPTEDVVVEKDFDSMLEKANEATNDKWV